MGGRVESQARATRSLWTALGVALLLCSAALPRARLGRRCRSSILATLPDAFVGAILALYIAGETWNVSSLVGLIGLFGIAVQNGLVLVDADARARRRRRAVRRRAARSQPRPRAPEADDRRHRDPRPLPLLFLPLHGTEIERPLAIVMIGGLITSTLFTLLALPTFCQLVHRWAAAEATPAPMRH